MKKKFSAVNLTIFKILISITLVSTVVAMILFTVTFLGMGFIIGNRGNVFPNNSRGILAGISENFSVAIDETGTISDFILTDESLLPEENWCILLDQNGDIVWSLHKPADIPDHYSLTDIARISKWFLNDYPVYMRIEDYGLFILGLPKNSVGKYSIEYNKEWYQSLPERILFLFVLNFFIALLLSSLGGSFLYKKIQLLTEGLAKLRREEVVTLPATGIFKEPFSNINQISRALTRKNNMLSSRDRARSNWISGISHDIRTPLSMVVGYGGQLAENPELSEENRKYAAVITAQGLKIKKLIEDLNLISSLEYEMQPIRKTAVHICVLLRSVVSELLNQDQPELYDISLSLDCEQAVVDGDEQLLARAFYNLLQNSISHNENGCRITVSGFMKGGHVCVVLADDGQGVPQKVLDNLDTLPNSAHGFGLPMACKIIRAHGGHFRAENRDGFVVTVELPEMEVY